jgi:hypothetical protein
LFFSTSLFLLHTYVLSLLFSSGPHSLQPTIIGFLIVPKIIGKHLLTLHMLQLIA